MMTSRGFRRGIAASAAGFVLGTPVTAQVAVTAGDGASVSCLAAIPDSAMTSVIASTTVSVLFPADSSARPALSLARALNAALGRGVREALGGSDSRTPSADAFLTWRDAHGGLRVTLHRTGKIAFGDADHPQAAPGAAVALVAAALADLAPGTTLEWPAAVPTDSIIVEIRLVTETSDLNDILAPAGTGIHEGVFTVRTPRTTPVRLIRAPRVTYPPGIAGEEPEGFVTLTFVVDTAGRVDVSTLRAVRSVDRRFLEASMESYYGAFVAALRRGMGSARYEPARFGGCALRVQVTQSFDLRQRR